MQYLLTIPSNLWQEFKVKCAQNNETMRAVLARLIKNYING